MKCVILAGGSGDRLWPLSRKNYPKQFIEIKENRSLLQETIVRNMPFCEEFLIVSNEKYRFIIEGQMQVFQGLKYRCFYEEVPRNTAAAVVLISLLVNPSELLFVVAADMVVGGCGYRENVLQAMNAAKKGKTALFGMPVTMASTRYGYIRHQGSEVLDFIEKPERKKAEEYFESGEFLWNSGMFLMCAGDFLQEVRRFQPQMIELAVKKRKLFHASSQEMLFDKEWLQEFPALSVEKAVFEQSHNLMVVQADFDWGDMDELEDVLPYTRRDERQTILRECRNVSVMNRTRKQLVVGNQLEDMMIINTEDTVYVAKKGSDSQNLKELMGEYQSVYGEYFERDRIAYRAWGHYEVLSQENGFKVKKVTIFPEKTIYAHMHDFRSEHWSIVSGSARITLNGETKLYQTNESVYVPKGIMHQVSNETEKNLIIIEVGIGEKLIETDMVSSSQKRNESQTLTADSIVRLEPAFKDYLWGGNRLRMVYGKKCDYDLIAESWELSAHPAGQSVLAEGRHKGMLFGDYVMQAGHEAWGWKCQSYEQFPILIKFIDAREALSIQVHPDDEFAMRNEGEYGKNEMWYVIDCAPDAFLYCGFVKEVTEEQVSRAIEEKQLPQLLCRCPVKPGDTIFIPAGTVHAIGAGILLCEIQQNSNSTYRMYDYGRTDKYGHERELHLEKAMQVLDCGQHVQVEETQPVLALEGGSRQLLGECKYFQTIKYVLDGTMTLKLEEASFTGIVFMKGRAVCQTEDKSLRAAAGDTFFIPAGRRELTVKGHGEFLFVQV